MKIVTDTATLVIYDLNMLKHRLDAHFDWWSDPDEELIEINQGNVLFVGLAEDGAYEVEVLNESGEPGPQAGEGSESVVRAVLKNSSGRFYIGPGEAVTSEGEEPEESVSGHFYHVTPVGRPF